jgi:hypothetical protein
MTIKTFKGKLAVGLQEHIHLSTNDGLTGYRIKNFQTISHTPGDGSVEHIMQIFTTDQTGSITAVVDFSNADLLAISYNKEQANTESPSSQVIIFDQETFNQDIFITLTDAAGGTKPGNFYLELEQMKLDLNASTYITVKNIRSRTQA